MNAKKELSSILIAGLVIGAIAALLVMLGNPANMGFCIACFLRDIAGGLGLHRAAAVQYIRPEIIGLVLGSLIVSFRHKEFLPRGGSSPLTRFVIAFFVMIGCLMFLGCPFRMILRLAGGDGNALFGLIGFVIGILCGVFVGMTTNSLGSTTIYQFTENATSQYYLEPGDKIVEVNGHDVGIVSELSFRIMWEAKNPTTAVVVTESGEKKTLENVGLVDITVIRDGKEMLICDVPFSMATEQGIGMGQMDFQVYRERASFSTVTRHTLCLARSNVSQIWASLGGLFTGRVNISHMSGPVGINEQMSEAAGFGFEYLIYFAALIAINLGVFNLLPIPALDGGRIFFLLIEAIRGKPISPEIEGKIHTVALVLLLALSVFVLFKDIFALFV